MNRANVPDKIILHHSADTEPGAQLVKINAWHKERGFNLSSMDYYVGYHYLIEKDGTFTQTRDIQEMGCHCLGQNFTSIGVCLAGNFDQELPTPAQLYQLGRLLAELCQVASISTAAIYPHRHFGQTNCNGTTLSDNFGVITLAQFIGERDNEQQPCTKTS